MIHFATRGWASALNTKRHFPPTESHKQLAKWAYEYGNTHGKFTGFTLMQLAPLVGTEAGKRKFAGEQYWSDAFDTSNGVCIFQRSQIIEKWEWAALLTAAVAASKRAPACQHPSEEEELLNLEEVGLGRFGERADVLIGLVFDSMRTTGKHNIRALAKKDLPAGGDAAEGFIWTELERNAVWAALRKHHDEHKKRKKIHTASQKATAADQLGGGQQGEAGETMEVDC
jgi:hypothetical protein